jgi:hypothetical protein
MAYDVFAFERDRAMHELEPYKPPAAPLDPPSADRGAAIAGYTSVETLGKVLAALTLAYGAIELVDALSYGMQIDLLSRISAHGSFTKAEVVGNDVRVAALSALGFVVYSASAVLFGVFVHRANRNARAFGAVGMEFTSGWAVGFFFVPIANLIMPYQAVCEIWKASGGDSSSWRTERVPSYFPAWWIAWTAGNVTATIALGMSNSKAPISLTIVGSVVAGASSFVLAVSSVLAARVVTDIRKRQELRSTRAAGASARDRTAQPIGG